MLHSRMMLPLLLAAVATGCAQGGAVRAVVPAELAPSTLTTPVPGEHYTYDDGIRRRVERITGGIVEWQDSRGTTITARPNPIAPELGWQNGDQRSSSRFAGDPDALWPLQAGARADFTVLETRLRGGVADPAVGRDWSCRVTGSERLTVPAGSFDTWVTECSRRDAQSGRSRGTRTLWYAPELGAVVQRSDRGTGGRERVRRLVGHGYDSRYLPDGEQAELRALLVEVLERHADGEAATWRSRALPVALLLVPVRSYAHDDGRSCRSYRSIYSVLGRLHVNERDYCRTDSGRGWKRET